MSIEFLASQAMLTLRALLRCQPEDDTFGLMTSSGERRLEFLAEAEGAPPACGSSAGVVLPVLWVSGTLRSAAENETVWKEQTRLRESTPRPQKRTCDIADTRGGASSDRNRTCRADLSSKPPWAPLCNRQPSNYIIIICNYSISSNDRSPPNPAVDKQALILPPTNRRFAIEFQAVRSCCREILRFCFSNHLNAAWYFPSIFLSSNS